MVNSINFYNGADYGLDSGYGSDTSTNYDKDFGTGYSMPAGQMGFTTDPRTANQLGAVSAKLNTGAKNIELTAIQTQVLDAIPNQHLDEINRLRKLVGADLTFHGPLIEPTGLTKQNWNESHREQSEKQMWSAVDRSHKLDPKGNMVVTFHSGVVGVDPEIRSKREVIDSKTGEKKIKEIISEYYVVNERDGGVHPVLPKADFFKSKEGDFLDSKKQVEIIKGDIEEQNKAMWFNNLFNISYHANQGSEIIERIHQGIRNVGDGFDKKALFESYKEYVKNGNESEYFKNLDEPSKKVYFKTMSDMVHADSYLRDAYQNLQGKFNQAYEIAQMGNNKEDLDKLNSFRSSIKDKLQYIEDPSHVNEFADMITKGVNVLRTISPPEVLKPMRGFMIDKASDTFANVAQKAYKKYGESAPIISIENPPAGTTPISRAKDLKQLVKDSRKKLTHNLMRDQHMSESDAKFQAEKLLGVTWDVGHINMIRKFGYTKKDVKKETDIIAKYVKHVHLSDNFGLDHTELPMGMGNVPIKPMLEAIGKYNKQAKKIIETGHWFEPFKHTPFTESLRAFGSPIYSMQMAPHWSNPPQGGGYFSGYGTVLPEGHFSMYGAGFSNLPVELGGQSQGGRSRFSGAPNQ